MSYALHRPDESGISLDVLEHDTAALAFWCAVGFRTHAHTLVAPAER